MSDLPDIRMSDAFREYIRELRDAELFDFSEAQTDNQGIAHPTTGTQFK
ncbi:hypothetical protein [Haloarcula sp. CGMCC 1.2071]